MSRLQDLTSQPTLIMQKIYSLSTKQQLNMSRLVDLTANLNHAKYIFYPLIQQLNMVYDKSTPQLCHTHD